MNSDILQIRILDYLTTVGGSATGKEIERNVQGKSEKIYAALKAMVNERKVLISGMGTKSAPTTYSLPILSIPNATKHAASVEYEEVFL